MELEIILAVIGSNAVFSFIQFLISRHDRKKNHISENDKNQSDMILGLGHDKLLFLTDKFVSRGVITMRKKEIWIICTSLMRKWEEMEIAKLDMMLVKNCGL